MRPALRIAIERVLNRHVYVMMDHVTQDDLLDSIEKAIDDEAEDHRLQRRGSLAR